MTVVFIKTGSSPRLRGTLSVQLSCPWVARFIPAPAGNAVRCALGTPRCAVHPRACGERVVLVDVDLPFGGSSPRLRGTQGRWWQQRSRHRFIPAPAGNARHRDCRSPVRTVHPRACGERAAHQADRKLGTGSSPRLRGTLPIQRLRPLQRRFIPAPAGNAISPASASSIGTVHPRACGERAAFDPTAPPANGSSPRLRGTHGNDGGHRGVNRFIPAPAGNANAGLSRWTITAVHPRACGERGYDDALIFGSGGSSPRLRGTRALLIDAAELRRFIPAPAGNASASKPES